ncbi:hypothetical protein [Halobacterium salinarum]|uniref:hypothetical protein n=1 Tax=Halobacterium salinarum TaxID=2242 RepID=UPI00255662C5|nr:hypothetical protein [Halobacterium salinarum]
MREFRFVGDGVPLVTIGSSIPEFILDSYEDSLFSRTGCIEDENVWVRIRPGAANQGEKRVECWRINGVWVAWFRGGTNRNITDGVATTAAPPGACPLQFTPRPAIGDAVGLKNEPS